MVMGRKRGCNNATIRTLVGALLQHPEGLWMNKLAQLGNIHPTTATRYVEGILSPFVEETALAGKKKPYLRVVRLKPFVLQKLEEGRTLDQILKLLDILKDIE